MSTEFEPPSREIVRAQILPRRSRESIVLEPASTQAQSLEGRSVDMYDSLMLPERTGLRLK